MGFLAILSIFFGLHATSGYDVPGKAHAPTPGLSAPAQEQNKWRQAEEDFHRGVQFAGGHGVVRDYVAAAKHYRKAAEGGHIPAQYHLACLFENGLGVERDLAQAAAWYRRAAERGDAESQNNLGVLYATGQGVHRDDAEAARWYRLAAEQNNLEALSNLASMYLEGRGVTRDSVQAFSLCRRAAENGYAVAQNNLALMYANGEGVARDYVWAHAWLDLTADQIPSAADLRDRIAKQMTSAQIARARELTSHKRAQFEAKKERAE